MEERNIKQEFVDQVGHSVISIALKLAEHEGVIAAAEESIKEFMDLEEDDSDDVTEAKKKTKKEQEEAKGFAERLKKHKGDVDNPWALAYWMQNKGYDIGKKKKKKSSLALEKIIIKKALSNQRQEKNNAS